MCFTSIQIDNEQNGVFSLALAKEKGVNRGPHDAARVEGLINIHTNLRPGACDRVAVSRARLVDEVLRLGSLAFRAGRGRLVDAGSATEHTEKFFISGRITVGETGRVGDVEVPDIVAIVGVELAERD